jgi:hypothetical protein
LNNTIAEQERIAAEKARKAEAERTKPIKCPDYTYAKEPESVDNASFTATLVGANMKHTGKKGISTEAGLTVEQCAQMIIDTEDADCTNKDYFVYAPSHGCYCFYEDV